MSILISPVHFSQRMESHWVETLGNASSDKLRGLWTQMGHIFGQAILASEKPDDNLWRVLEPPTGTGKTQGLCVYGSMVAAANLKASENERLGILIVTRLITQCDEIVETINDLSGRPVALARHSGVNVTADQVQAAEILVVTHSTYTTAIDGLTKNAPFRWSSLTSWKHGQRRLTVIDEALTNMVEEHRVSADDVSQARGMIPTAIQEQFPDQIQALMTVEELLRKISNITAKSTAEDAYQSRVVWRSANDGKITMPDAFRMDPLAEALNGHEYDRAVLGKHSLADRRRLRESVESTLRAVQAVMERWAYYAKKGDHHTFNASVLALPDHVPGPIVLDATATQNFIWELLEDRASIAPIPTGARSYRNVTLHVARANGLGKGKMTEKHKERIPRLLDDLQDRLSPSRKVFLCCHLGVEPYAKTFEPDFAAYDVGHWGAVDGRNDWKGFDVAVLFGLSYRDHIWANNAFMAFRGLQDDEWLRRPSYGEYDDVRQMMQERQLAASIIQAINRVQCRKVIDEHGNCPSTDVFVLLPNGRAGEAILNAIQSEMPGIAIAEWEFELDDAAKRETKVRRGSSHEAIISYMKSQPPGEIDVRAIREELQVSSSVWKESVAPALRQADHPLTQSLIELGVTYVVKGKGRGSKSLLIKL